MKMNNVTFNLVTLYTSSKSERHSVSHNQRLQVNRMLVRNNNQDNEASASNQNEAYEVRPAIKELCQSVDGFIFVVDASIQTKEGLFFIIYSLLFSIRAVTISDFCRSRITCYMRVELE